MQKIAFVSQPEYFRFIYEDCLDDIFETREFLFQFDMREEDFDELVNFEADYNFFFRGEFFPEPALRRIKGVKIALSSEPFPRKIDGKWEYTLDSVRRYLAFRKIRDKSFDYAFHYDLSSMPLFEKDGLVISGEFVFPVALDIYRPAQEEKKWSLFFIGRSSKYREKFFMPLKHQFTFLHIAHGIWGPELVEYINRSKICLNIHAAKEVSWEPRMQMMLACGAFVISEKISPNPYLRSGIDYVEFSDARDLQDKVAYYLTHDKDREEIVENAKCRVREQFDSKRKFVALIDGIIDGRYSIFSTNGPANSFMNALAFIARCFRKL
jgi:hypothetical protein